MEFNDSLIQSDLEEGKVGKVIAGVGLIIALLAGHKADLKNLDSAQHIIRTELSREIRDIIPDGHSKKERQEAFQEWSNIVQAAKRANPELNNYPALYRAGQAIIMNPSLLNRS